MLSQRQSQRQLLKLTPQQIQYMKLLQVPTVDLEQRIKEELEINPALEEGAPESEDSEESELDAFEDSSQTDDFDAENSRQTDEFDMNDHYDEEDVAGYKLRDNNQVAFDEIYERPLSYAIDLQDQLHQQLGMLSLSPLEEQIGELIVGNIDDAGYLQRSVEAMVNDLAFSQNVFVSEKEIENILKQIQRFDPPGVGGRNLQECLKLQLESLLREDNTTLSVQSTLMLALDIVQKHFEAFTKKQYEKIREKLDVDEEECRDAIEEIVHLNPKPGMAAAETSSQTPVIMPDFFLSYQDGKLQLSLNDRNDPDLRINYAYTQMYDNYKEKKKKNSKEKETNVFLKQKIDSAQWFIELLRQRAHTMESIMESIIDFQYDYFVSGEISFLKPMRLKDIAEITAYDISTISRVTANKYIQTHFGIFLLKEFFSNALENEQGEMISTAGIKEAIEQIIEGENKSEPLTDEILVNMLKEKGFSVARRTVSKYREALGISVARLRREA